MVGTVTGSRNPEGNRWGDNYAVHPDNWTLETWKLAVSGIKQILKDTAGLKAALGMEAQGREMYLRASKEASHPQEKKFYKLLAAEEDTHFAIIYEYLDYLEDQGLRMRE